MFSLYRNILTVLVGFGFYFFSGRILFGVLEYVYTWFVTLQTHDQWFTDVYFIFQNRVWQRDGRDHRAIQPDTLYELYVCIFYGYCWFRICISRDKAFFFPPKSTDCGYSICPQLQGSWKGILPLVRSCVSALRFLMHSITSEPCILGFWNFIYGFLMTK